MRHHDLGGPALRSGWAPFYLLTGFIAGALSMLGVILWVLSDREPLDWPHEVGLKVDSND